MAPAAPVTPPILQGPSAKEKKYDRQLRLWAASGQQALEDAHILLLNSGSGVVGVETLKNLVLPGTGTFTIVDEAAVSDEDLGVNFFLEQSSLGKSRAEETCRLLLELNPEVKGHAEHRSISDFVEEADLSRYTLILLIAPTSSIAVTAKVSDIAWDLRLPLFYIHSVGFYSHFSVQLPPSFPIVETHPDPLSTQDLRLLQPWPELLNYAQAQTAELESLSDHDHGHIPYLVLLLHYLEQWKASHNGSFDHHKDKAAFKDFVRGHARTNNSDGGEENYDEALNALNRALILPEVPSSLKAVLAEEECQNPKNSSVNFWIIANAISSFITSNSVLPLPGAVPDMKAQSKDYIALQTLYRKKSQSDIAEVTVHVRNLEQKLNRHVPIESKEIEAFCKGAAFIRLIRGRKLIVDPLKYGWSDNSIDTITEVVTTMNYVTMKESIFPLLIALYAHDSAVAALSSSKSSDALLSRLDDAAMEKQMQQYISSIFQTLTQSPELESAKEQTFKLAAEIVRSGPGELHNISSLTGGMVAQEVIKIITKQYVPVDNCCLFDGIGSASAVFRL